jgi:UDP-glucuronate 4-epimerase
MILVTGAAGFIGSALSARLKREGHAVVGCDNYSDYYDVSLKRARVQALLDPLGVPMHEIDLADQARTQALFKQVQPSGVIHLAAQPGVRYSLINPAAYINANLTAFGHVIEAARQHQVGHFIYASSSSVYGANKTLPWSEHHAVDHPVSLYAATKKANELMAHTYSHLYALPTTGLRFFTVYGPWGRPDMAPFLFAHAITHGQPIQVFNQGDMSRDFTYVDDIVEGIVRLINLPPTADANFDPRHPQPQTSHAPFRVLNIGNHEPVPLLDFIALMEEAFGAQVEKQLRPMQPGDVQSTYADTALLHALTGFAPSTPLRDGIARFAQWYKTFYREQRA